jgi:Domain of unknown function (DUF4394)
MRRRSLGRRALALGAVLALAAPAAAQARDMYVTDQAGNLLRFDARYPGLVLDTTPITGLAAGASVVGMDFRPKTGDLIAVGSNSVVYALDPATAVATPIGSGFVPGLTGTSFGVDVNPVPDALRITSNARQNYRVSFATGNHAMGSPDGALNPGAPSIVGSAYTNSALTATNPAATTLFGVDSASDQLFTQNPPNNGTLTGGKPLGVDITDTTGFDIAGAGNIGYMATTPAGAGGASFYRVDINSGAATRIGPIATGSLVNSKGTPAVTITALAARQEVVAPKANIAPGVQIVKTTQVPRPGQRAAYIAQAMDPDGAIAKVEWDTDADGRFDDATTGSLRIAFPAGTRTIAARATDERGARTAATTKVVVRR